MRLKLGQQTFLIRQSYGLISDEAGIVYTRSSLVISCLRPLEIEKTPSLLTTRRKLSGSWQRFTVSRHQLHRDTDQQYGVPLAEIFRKPSAPIEHIRCFNCPSNLPLSAQHCESLNLLTLVHRWLLTASACSMRDSQVLISILWCEWYRTSYYRDNRQKKARSSKLLNGAEHHHEWKMAQWYRQFFESLLREFLKELSKVYGPSVNCLSNKLKTS